MGIVNRLRSAASQEGSASIEATIVLPVFVFIVCAIYTLVSFCVVQARVSYAIDTAAKEMSQYSYVYHVLRLDSVANSLDDKSGQVVGVYEDLSNFINTGKSEASSASSDISGYLAGLLDGSNSGASELKESGAKVSSDLSDIVSNPSDYVKSLGALALSKVTDQLKTTLAASFAKGLTWRHFGDSRDQANAYLKAKGVTGGFDGIDFSRSTMLQGKSGDIVIIATYELDMKSIVPFVDTQVTIVQSAATKAWLGGDKGVTSGWSDDSETSEDESQGEDGDGQ